MELNLENLKAAAAANDNGKSQPPLALGLFPIGGKKQRQTTLDQMSLASACSVVLEAGDIFTAAVSLPADLPKDGPGA